MQFNKQKEENSKKEIQINFFKIQQVKISMNVAQSWSYK